MKQKLIDVLSSFGYPVFLQGSLNAEDAYPSTFITYWTNGVDDDQHYNNLTIRYIWDFQVIIYSNDPLILEQKREELRLALISNGFLISGKGMDIPSDEPTHTGWAMDVSIIEYEKKEN